MFTDELDLGCVLYEHTCCYSAVELAEVTRRAYEVIWEQGAKDASLSLGHGGHNADNPYKKEN